MHDSSAAVDAIAGGGASKKNSPPALDVSWVACPGKGREAEVAMTSEICTMKENRLLALSK